MRPARSISSSRDFRRVLRAPRGQSDGLAVHLFERGDEAPARLGIAVPRSIGGAVARNRVRRRLKAAFATCGPRAGCDVMIKASGPAASLDFQELGTHLAVALSRAKRPG